ncbi:tannase and feruloyl esterase [Xylariomycetidae sp. FL0641]|nr:tannase and feruloyl esterase [Xylariomycetidae sp. FL0641]
MRPSLTLLVAGLGRAGALLSKGPTNCSAATADIDFDAYNATFLNATHYESHALNVSGTANNYSFCEVYAAVRYASNASMVFALWLPEIRQYRNRFLAVGNGGLAGTIDYRNMMKQLNAGFGFAVAGGNSGHDAYAETHGNGYASPGTYVPYLHHEPQVKAWIHNAISLFTPLAKSMTAKYYEREPRYMYYNGCSTGGGQGFALAQYHPDLFDGIFAGSPGNYYDSLMLSTLWNAEALSGDGYLSQAELNFTTQAVLDACDGLDGVQDGIIENPLACPFDVETLACEEGEKVAGRGSANDDTVDCLTSAQIRALKAVYAGPTTADTHESIYPGFSLGSEKQWFKLATDMADQYGMPVMQNLVYNNLSWDRSSFGWTRDEVRLVHERAGRFIDETSTDLGGFRRRNGKMLTTQGWADEYVSAEWPVRHFEDLREALPAAAGEHLADFYSLFMVPGGGHCAGGRNYPGAPGEWHVMAPLIDWVERGVKPRSVLATGPADGSGRTRKLCPWPATARYVGGDSDAWTSFVCE